MKIRFEERFLNALNDQVDYIARDKPSAARKFKNDLLKSLSKDLKYPLHFKKSIYFENQNIRDYVFKIYIIVYYLDSNENTISVFGFVKYKNSL